MSHHRRKRSVMGSRRKWYASVTTWKHEPLEQGEPNEHALIFTEREGFEHLRPDYLDSKTREFYLEIYGDPSTWRRLDKRTQAGRAALAAQAAYMEAGRIASEYGARLRAQKLPEQKSQYKRLIADYHGAERTYAAAVKQLPITPQHFPATT